MDGIYGASGGLGPLLLIRNRYSRGIARSFGLATWPRTDCCALELLDSHGGYDTGLCPVSMDTKVRGKKQWFVFAGMGTLSTCSGSFQGQERQ